MIRPSEGAAVAVDDVRGAVERVIQGAAVIGGVVRQDSLTK